MCIGAHWFTAVQLALAPSPTLCCLSDDTNAASRPSPPSLTRCTPWGHWSCPSLLRFTHPMHPHLYIRPSPSHGYLCPWPFHRCLSMTLMVLPPPMDPSLWWLAPARTAMAAFIIHAASPALYFCVLHPRTAPHGVDTISHPSLVSLLCLAPFSFCTYYTNSALSKYFCHDPLWKDTMPMVLFRCPSCLFSSEAPPISIHKMMRSVCKSKDNGQAG